MSATGPRFERPGDGHEAIRDDLAAFALDALPAEEAAEVRSHLEVCESCRARLRWLEPAVATLPASVEQRTPPESLRESLMAVVREEAGAEGRADVAPVREPTAPWWRRFGSLAPSPAAALAVVAVLAVGVAGGWALRGGDGETDAGSSFVEAQVPSGLANSVSATLERHGESATLHVHQLPKLNRDEVYAVWVNRAGAMELASVFALKRDGTATAAVPGPLDGVDGVAVTREPRRIGQQPTNPQVLKAPL